MILKELPNGIGAGATELKVLRPFSNTLDGEYLLFFLESSYFVDEAIFKGTANQLISGYLEKTISSSTISRAAQNMRKDS